MTAGPPPRAAGEPHPALNVLNRLVGTWTVTGAGLDGALRCDWTDGGHFLAAHLDLTWRGRRVTGVEYIGHDPARDALTGGSRRYRLDGDTITVRSEGTGRARFVGTFDGDAGCTGRWESAAGAGTATWRRVP